MHGGRRNYVSFPDVKKVYYHYFTSDIGCSIVTNDLLTISVYFFYTHYIGLMPQIRGKISIKLSKK
jgi:hypothetical protein